MATCENRKPTELDVKLEWCMAHDQPIRMCWAEAVVTSAREVVRWRRQQNLLAFEVYGPLETAVEIYDGAPVTVERGKGSYRDAAGALGAFQASFEALPEDVIRRIRDAG